MASETPKKLADSRRFGRVELDSFTNALQLLNSKTHLHTGYLELDSLLGKGAELGAFYLFYGEDVVVVDLVLHRLMASALGCSEESRVVYLNCGNYREEKTLLDIPNLIRFIKALRLDPASCLERVTVFCAFSEEQQEQVVLEVSEAVEHDSSVKLLVIHNAAKLFTTQGRKDEALYLRIPNLQKAMSRLWQTCASKGVAMVASCRVNLTQNGVMPRPEGGRYLSHLANVIVYFEKARGLVPTLQAHLVKHSAKPPTRTSLDVGGGKGLGRITVPFKMRIEQELEELAEFRDALKDVGRRSAYDRLVEACLREQGAMANANIPAALDALLLTAVVDNRNRIDGLSRQLAILETSICRLQTAIQEIVEKETRVQR